MDYKLTQEYRDRFAFNQGDIYFLKEALEFWSNKVGEDINKMLEEGKRPIATPEFFKQLADGLIDKAQQWTDK